MRSFGEILRLQRQKRKLTQKQVADAAKVSDAYICSLESDKRSPPPYHTVVVIANALKYDVDQLWRVAARTREKQAVAKSQRKTMPRKSDDDDLQEDIPDSQINAFFKPRDISMTVFGLFEKLPTEMTMEEKRVVYQAINSAQKFVLERTDE